MIESKTKKLQAAQGMTLIEVALVLLLGTLMFVPIVTTLGSKNAGGSGTGLSSTSSNAQHTRELVAANNIMDRALGGEIMSKNVAAMSDLVNTGGNTFNLAAVPINGTPVTFPANGTTYTYGDEDQGVRLQYRWRIQDVSYDSAGNRLTPEGNRVLRATMDVYPVGAAATDPPSYTFSSYLYNSESYTPPSDPKVGLALILDTSGSMTRAPNGDRVTANGVTTPYLKDRFHREDALPTGTTLSSAGLNLYDDRNLDITWSQPSDETSTQFNETFLKVGVLGLPTCDLTSNATTATLRNWFYTVTNANNQRTPLLNICGDFSALSYDPQWKDQVNKNITRIEAARNALLGFTIAIENDTDLTKNLDMGFVTFDSNGTLETALESAQLINDPANSNIGKLRFKNNRDRISWINRYDEKNGTGSKRRTIPASGITNTADGLAKARAALLARTGLSKRIIILLTDGDPNPNSGNNSQGNLANTTAKNYYQNDGIQIYTIGFAGLSANGENMLKKMAENSSGQYFYADNADDLNKIFFTLSYELRKQLLLSRVTRYNPALGNQLNCDPAKGTCYTP